MGRPPSKCRLGRDFVLGWRRVKIKISWGRQHRSRPCVKRKDGAPAVLWHEGKPTLKDRATRRKIPIALKLRASSTLKHPDAFRNTAREHKKRAPHFGALSDFWPEREWARLGSPIAHTINDFDFQLCHWTVNFL